MHLRSFAATQLLGQESIELRAPHDQRQVIGMMPVCSKDDLAKVIVQAKIVQNEWAQQSIEVRASAIESFIPLIEARLDELVEVLKAEQGMLDSVVRQRCRNRLAKSNTLSKSVQQSSHQFI